MASAGIAVTGITGGLSYDGLGLVTHILSLSYFMHTNNTGLKPFCEVKEVDECLLYSTELSQIT